ncbi:MAG: hypothetical protein R3C26_02755 [Calditrichia bacterium]
MVSTTATGVFNANLASIVMLNPGTQNTVKTIIKDGGDEKSRGYKLLQTNLIGWSLKHKQACSARISPRTVGSHRKFPKNLARKPRCVHPAKSAEMPSAACC